MTGAITWGPRAVNSVGVDDGSILRSVEERGCTQIPISTLSHIWVFVRLYGIVFVIIAIIVIIIIMIIKSEGVNAQL